MNNAILLVTLLNLITSYVAYKKSQSKMTILEKPSILCEPFGSFVWADHVLFGPFWVIVSFTAFLLQDMLLFFLIFSVFWVIRGSGETIYWFFQQFHPRVGNEPEKFWINKHVPGEAVWFMHQIFWQCVTVVALILSIYLTYLWIVSLK